MTITATAQGGRNSSDWGSGGGGASSVDTTVTTSLLSIVQFKLELRTTSLTYEVAKCRVNPEVSKHILGVSLFGFYVNDIFQILSGDFAA